MKRIANEFCTVLAATALSACGPGTPSESSRDTRELTGAHTRIAWVQDAGTDSDPLSDRGELRLMGLDSDDGRGERALLPTVSNYAKPMITAEGNRIVYSDRIDRSIWIVDWDGSNHRRLSDGFAVDLWRDKDARVDWVYAVEQFGNEGTLPCRRFPVDEPHREETVWDGMDVTWGWFSVAGDGLRAAATCPWPDAGLLDLTTGSWHRYRIGCWPDIAPDGSHLFWALDGPHRNLHVLRESSRSEWQVDLSTAPGIEGLEIYHPRWTNHVRHLAISAPYTLGDDDIKLDKGGPGVEIYLGRFDANYTRIEAWARATRNDRGDFWPDAWIQGGSEARVPASVASPAPTPALQEPGIDSTNHWPGDLRDLVFLWRDSLAPNEVISGNSTRVCRVEPQKHARWGRHGTMNTNGGSFLARREGEQVIEACRLTGAFALEMLVTPRRSMEPGGATIVCFSDTTGQTQIRLLQDRETIYLEISAAQDPSRVSRFPVGSASAEMRTHLVVNVSGGTVESHVNGEPVFTANAPEADPRSWTGGSLRFGDTPNHDSNWSGSIEGIAIYARTVKAREVSLKHDLYQSRLHRRRTVPGVEVQARLVHPTPTPEPRTLAPYRRALAVFSYDVEAGLDDERIQVVHWTILDGQRLPGVADRIPGTVHHLKLAPFDEHPELSTERILMERVDPKLPFYYDLSDP